MEFFKQRKPQLRIAVIIASIVFVLFCVDAVIVGLGSFREVPLAFLNSIWLGVIVFMCAELWVQKGREEFSLLFVTCFVGLAIIDLFNLLSLLFWSQYPMQVLGAFGDIPGTLAGVFVSSAPVILQWVFGFIFLGGLSSWAYLYFRYGMADENESRVCLRRVLLAIVIGLFLLQAPDMYLPFDIMN